VLGRVLAVAMNAYREFVRARVLYALLGVALAASGYALLVATLSLGEEARVVSDLGSSSISLFTVLVAIVLGATSLHRELELKTLFPILARPVRRHEVLLGKFVGTLATLAVFVAIDGAAVLATLAWQTRQKPALVGGTVLLLVAILAVLLVRARHSRVFVLLPWSAAALLAMVIVADTASGDRRLVLASCALTMAEAAVVTAVAIFFSSFSSPALTATFTLGVWIVGRSADTLAHLPVRQFGETIPAIGRGLARVFPNLHLFTPPRPVLLGEVSEMPTWPFVGQATAHALLYCAAALAGAALVFRRRDFT
jgi:ABC-type transport system involved in multi-copper enzyme maturation permease subunit